MDNYHIIWLDLNFNELNDYICQLRQYTLYPVRTFTQPDECADFLLESQYAKAFFIVSHIFAETVIPLIHETLQLYQIYILSDVKNNDDQQWIKKWDKIKGVFTDISNIIDIFRQNIRQYEQNFGSISIVPTNYDLALNELDPSFMYSQLIKEMLLEMDHNEQEAKKQFVQFCQDEYIDNNVTIDAVNDFERDYKLHTPIWWYTKEPFIYLVLNRALRMQNIEVILKMGFFIRDLHQQIEQLYLEKNQTTNLILYRGQGILKTEFEKMKKNQGGLMAFNNFLSTSYDEQVSRAFAISSADDPDLTGILFQIEINPLVASMPFASLDNVSYYADAEKEILFSMHTVFRIGDIQQVQEQLWKVQLILTSDNDEQLQRLTNRVRHETRGPIGNYRLGTLMMKMGEYERAIVFFRTLIEKTSHDNWELLAHLYHQLGSVYTNQSDNATALTHFNKALSFKEKFLSPTNLEFTTTYNNIAMVYQSMGNYSLALPYYQKSLEIQQKLLPTTHSDLATTYNNIGLIYRLMGNATMALSYFQQAVDIQQKSLPATHPELASTYSNIGTIYHFIGDYPNALSYFFKTLQIQQKSLPPTHPHLCTVYNNIGMIYDAMGDYTNALSYYQKILDAKEKNLPSTHPDFAIVYSNLGGTYYAMENYSLALEYFKKSAEIQELTLPPNHPSLATTYNNIGGIYDAMEEPSIALLYYKKTLEIEEKSLPPTHPSLAVTYNNIGMAYETMKDYTTTLSYYQKALEIHEKNLPSNHPELATVYNNMGATNYYIQDYLTSVTYYQKAIEIRERLLPSNHSDLISVYNNIGVSYRLAGDHSSALTYLEKTLKILEETHTSNYRLLASVHYNIAKIFEDKHQYQKAIEHISRAIHTINYTNELNSTQKQKYEAYLNELQLKL